MIKYFNLYRAGNKRVSLSLQDYHDSPQVLAVPPEQATLGDVMKIANTRNAGEFALSRGYF
jgi:hypothetical protein